MTSLYRTSLLLLLVALLFGGLSRGASAQDPVTTVKDDQGNMLMRLFNNGNLQLFQNGKLTLPGMLESTGGGFVLPDGTVIGGAGDLGLGLPFSGSVEIGNPAFEIENTGSGPALRTVGNVVVGSGDIRAPSGAFVLQDGTRLTGASDLGQLSLPFSSSTSGSSPAFEVGNSGSGPAIQASSGDIVASSGDIVLSDGTALGGSDDLGGFSLPFSSSTSTSNGTPLLDLTQTGGGRVGVFEIDNTNSSADALQARNNGSGDGLRVVNNGSGFAGDFQQNGSFAALRAQTDGGAQAGVFGISNQNSSANALSGSTNGSGNAVRGFTSGSGNALLAKTTGSGNAAFFEGGDVVVSSGAFVLQDGTRLESSDDLGGFSLPFSGSTSTSSPALDLENTGTGPALQATGNIVAGNGDIVASSGDIVLSDGTTLSGSGDLGGFSLPFSSSTSGSSPAFEVGNSGSGPAIQASSGDIVASSGDIVLSDGTALSGSGDLGGFSLPFSRIVSTTSPLLDLKQTGDGGRVGVFEIDNTGSDRNALRVETNGSGNALFAQTTGTGNAALFSGGDVVADEGDIVAQTGNIEAAGGDIVASSGDIVLSDGTALSGSDDLGGFSLPFSSTVSTSGPLLDLTQTGNGRVGRFFINNTNSSAEALRVFTNGSGVALKASNGGNGNALFATINGSGDALVASNRGSGNAIKAMSGSGSAGHFTIGGPNDGSGNAIRAINNSSGSAGLFEIGNSNSFDTALRVETVGVGAAGVFDISNESNTADALVARTDGSGNAARFEGNVQVNNGGVKAVTGDFEILDSDVSTTPLFVRTNGSGDALVVEAGGSGDAGRFGGDVEVGGTLSANSKNFRIDHPQDPTGKYLRHAAVESPRRLTTYTGNVTLNSEGKATVELPDYFESLNRNYRYQLTAIGAAAPRLHVAEEIRNNAFRVAGGKPGMKVSWRVTAVRDDAWARENALQVEEEKPPSKQGTYVNPEAHGASPQEKTNQD